jgi:hypothetical protein
MSGNKHLAANPANLPDVLTPYHPDTKPGCSIHMYNNLQYFTTHISNLIHEVNSMMGISVKAWATLTAHTILCESCQCMFSEDGYNAHLKHQCCTTLATGKCISCSMDSVADGLLLTCILVPNLTTFHQPTMSNVKPCSYPSNYKLHISQMHECVNTMVGQAFL